MDQTKSGIVGRLMLWLAVLAGLLSGGPALAETITYFHNDIAGTPIAASDASGNVIWKENYQPFGGRMNNLPASGSNDQWFAGKPVETATGLSYFGARYYDPALGRFMGIDPKEVDPGNLHSFNRYSYGNNNPYRFVDPDGRSPLGAVVVLVGWMATGAIMEGGVNASLQYLAHGSVRWEGVGGVWDAASEGAVLGPVLGAAAGRSSIVSRELSVAKGAAEAAKPVFPKTAKEMDKFLGVEGKRVPDTAKTPGRDKVVWEPNSSTKITIEKHPYHPNAPDWHKDTHYHVDTPGKSHERFLPGDNIPGY